MTAEEVRQKLREVAEPERARALLRFFKTGRGEYGEGDRFLGVKVPESRRVARSARDIPRKELLALLRSPIHEERLVALLILVECFERAKSEREREDIYRTYVRNREYVNNWDLVDLSAPVIVGGYLFQRDKSPLYAWARSKCLWERRTAVLATYHFIKRGKYADTLKLARILLQDEEDLIHKAVGWMLREVGNRSVAVEERFLQQNSWRMPRTMLRYAIEKFPAKKRQAYLKGCPKLRQEISRRCNPL
ncbi:MAG: DNA alkylation repair protein [Acidobacteriota bacterium]